METRGANTLLQSTLALVLGAFFMTIFELVFLFVIVFPQVKSTLNAKMKTVENLEKVEKRFALLGAFAKALEERERSYRRKINTTAASLGWALAIVLLVCVLVLLRFMRHRGVGVRTPVIMCLLTVAILMSFQVWFYYRTRDDYKYISNNAEMMEVVLADICDGQ